MEGPRRLPSPPSDWVLKSDVLIHLLALSRNYIPDNWKLYFQWFFSFLIKMSLFLISTIQSLWILSQSYKSINCKDPKQKVTQIHALEGLA